DGTAPFDDKRRLHLAGLGVLAHLNHPAAKRKLFAVGAAAALAQREPGVADLSAFAAVAEAGEDDIGGNFLHQRATGADKGVFSEVIDNEGETADGAAHLVCHRLDYVREGGVVVLAFFSIASARDEAVDQD